MFSSCIFLKYHKTNGLYSIVCEAHMLHIRFAYNLHNICIWFAYDLHMIYIWITYHLHMIYMPRYVNRMWISYDLHIFVCTLCVIYMWFTYIRVQFMLMLNTIFHKWVCYYMSKTNWISIKHRSNLMNIYRHL